LRGEKRGCLTRETTTSLCVSISHRALASTSRFNPVRASHLVSLAAGSRAIAADGMNGTFVRALLSFRNLTPKRGGLSFASCRRVESYCAYGWRSPAFLPHRADQVGKGAQTPSRPRSELSLLEKAEVTPRKRGRYAKTHGKRVNLTYNQGRINRILTFLERYDPIWAPRCAPCLAQRHEPSSFRSPAC
jgi:hypothetical protein